MDLISNGNTSNRPPWENYWITPLHLACLEGLELVAEALVKHVNLLLLMERTSDGSTPLHLAVENGQWKMCILLLKLKAGFRHGKREPKSKVAGKAKTLYTSPLELGMRFLSTKATVDWRCQGSR